MEIMHVRIRQSDPVQNERMVLGVNTSNPNLVITTGVIQWVPWNIDEVQFFLLLCYFSEGVAEQWLM